jgi:thiol-disulfide isomerase/thioredoxin
MKRWILIALGVAVVVTVLTWLPVNPAGWLRRASADNADGVAGAGCPAGAPAANFEFTLKDLHGREVRLADYKGKVIVLDFWATWCQPCREEIPGLIELQDKYRAQGLVVLGISIDDPIGDLPPFAREFKTNYPLLVGLDREDVFAAYGPIAGVPTTLLIGRDGRICRREVGLTTKEDFEREIKGLL